MAIDLSAKRIGATELLDVRNADGSFMTDESGTRAQVRVHSPASKVFEVADAAMRRKVMQRVREAGGKIEAASETPEDKTTFLCAVTEEFIGLSHPDADPNGGAKAFVGVIYADPNLGYIRDDIYARVKDWGSFTTGPQSS